MAISTVSDPSGSGRVDMLTDPVAAARAVVATEAWVKSKHNMYLIRGSVGGKALFLPIRRRIKKKKKKKSTRLKYVCPVHGFGGEDLRLEVALQGGKRGRCIYNIRSIRGFCCWTHCFTLFVVLTFCRQHNIAQKRFTHTIICIFFPSDNVSYTFQSDKIEYPQSTNCSCCRLIPQHFSRSFITEPTSHSPFLKAPPYTSLPCQPLVHPAPRQCSTPTPLSFHEVRG